MSRLGYDRYVAHGEDTGAAISRELAVIDPEHVAALHLTMIASATVTAETADPDNPAEQRAVQIALRTQYQLGAYALLQASRPQTLSYALTDSPVGQLAWIVERFKDWTDSTDAPEDAVDRDAMLTNVMIYWLSGTAGSSARYYYEGAATWGRPEPEIDVPVAVVVMPHDIGHPVRRIAEQNHNIVRWTEFDGAATSPPWRNPTSWSPTCVPPSATTASRQPARPIDGGRRWSQSRDYVSTHGHSIHRHGLGQGAARFGLGEGPVSPGR